MSVIDASVMVDALVGVGVHGRRGRAELSRQPLLQVPTIFAAEVVSALRAMVHRGHLDAARAAAAVEQVRVVRTQQFPFEPFARRTWELRSGMTVYDGWYVALAETLGSELITTDSRLVRASGPRCTVRLPEQ